MVDGPATVVSSTTVFIEAANAQHPTSRRAGALYEPGANISPSRSALRAGGQHPIVEPRSRIRCSMFGVRCSGFSSFFLLQPFLPATSQHEHVFDLRFVAQAARYFAREVAALRAAIDDHFLLRRPCRQKLG